MLSITRFVRATHAVEEEHVIRHQAPTLVHGLTGRLPLGQALCLATEALQGGCSIPLAPDALEYLLSAPGAAERHRNLTPIRLDLFQPSEHIAPGRRTGKYRLGTDQFLTNDEGESFISLEDDAFALLDEIEKPQFIRQRFTAVS